MYRQYYVDCNLRHDWNKENPDHPMGYPVCCCEGSIIICPVVAEFYTLEAATEYAKFKTEQENEA